MKIKRWLVLVHLRHFSPEPHWIEELEELQKLIEGGPNFRDITKIEIFYMRNIG